MVALTVRNLDEETVRRLRARAAEHGRSAEAEHRKILRVALSDSGLVQTGRQNVASLLAEFRSRTGGRGSPAPAELLRESRAERMQSLVGADDDP